jgi:membrane fusion protein, copper/silver efflux system
MNKVLIGGIAVLAILSSAYVVQRSRTIALRASQTAMAPTAALATAPADHKVLYWKAPDGTNDFSPTAKKAADGRDYVPVFDEQEPEIAPAQKAAAPKAGKGKLLYYRNPMGLADTSPVPKKDWMGMDYIAVYEGEDDGGSTVKISLDRVQRSGVRTAPVEMRKLERPVRAPGVAKPDERTLRVVTLRADGFIEKLYVNETGRHVKAGEPLFRVYSPQMVSVQVDYRTALNVPGSRDERGPLQRMKNLGIPDAVVEEIRRTREPVIAFDWPSPVTGVVMRKPVMEGMMVKAGEELFRFADLSTVWVIADVPEQDIAQVKVGAMASLTFRSFPGETFTGTVTFVLHELEMATRAAKVRIEVRNTDHRIKHEMFADVVINEAGASADRLVVPTSALIDSGNRQVVIIDKGEGRFEPRAVKVGVRGDGFVEITDGVKAGEIVVVTATFLIDAESNLKAALQAFTAEPMAKMEGKP